MPLAKAYLVLLEDAKSPVKKRGDARATGRSTSPYSSIPPAAPMLAVLHFCC
jgi:hypothetical protein